MDFSGSPAEPSCSESMRRIKLVVFDTVGRVIENQRDSEGLIKKSLLLQVGSHMQAEVDKKKNSRMQRATWLGYDSKWVDSAYSTKPGTDQSAKYTHNLLLTLGCSPSQKHESATSTHISQTSGNLTE